MACTHLPFQFPCGLSGGLTKPMSSGAFKFSKRTNTSAFSSSIGSLRLEIDENPEAIISGEWPDNFSLLSFDDLRFYFESHTTDDDINVKVGPSMLLGEVMSTSIILTTTEQTLEEIDGKFEIVSGLPVVDDECRCIGVISKSDRAKASNGMKSKVGEVMSSPPITLPPNKTVKDAAALMLKMKIHRIPILNEKNQVIGMVTRTDIFQALEALDIV